MRLISNYMVTGTETVGMSRYAILQSFSHKGTFRG